MQDKFCIHGLVSGLVQGVCFRSATQTKAKALGLHGWVRNVPDGRVEVYACGERAALDELQAWLQHGPARAKVDHVEMVEAVLEDHDDFNVIQYLE